MAGKAHRYDVALEWTGAGKAGTASYRAYTRDYVLSAEGKPDLAGSADPWFHGDRTRWNPEELLLGALSACHALSYFHVCAASGVVVIAYADTAEGKMVEDGRGGGRFTEVVLRPRVKLAPGSDAETALSLHHEASRLCFIAASVNFPVRHAPEIVSSDDPKSVRQIGGR